MLGKIPSLISAAAKGLAASGSSDWISDEQKAQAVNDIEEARQYANAQQKNMATQHPIANLAGNFAGTALQYGAVNGALEGTAAASALTEKLGEHGANLALGEMADIALDTIPTEVENYQNGMRGKDLAVDTLKNLGVNAAFNLGEEGLGMIPGLLKNRKAAQEVAQDVAETAAKSAPTEEIAENTLKQLEPPVREELNPLGMATQDAELEALAAQRQSAMDAIDGLREQIPETPSQPLTDLADRQIPSIEDAEWKELETTTQKQRGYVKSMVEKTDLPKEVKDAFVDDPDLYNQISNKNTFEAAQKIFDENSLEDAQSIYRGLLNKRDPRAVPLSDMINRKLIDEGRTEEAVMNIRDMAEKMTKSGQFTQAAIINLTKNDPMTALQYAVKDIDKLNTEGAKKFGKKWKDFALTEDEINAFKALKPGDKEGIKALLDQVGERIGKEYPTTMFEKLKEARRIAMLLNTRTNIRNTLANVPTAVMRSISDRVEAVGQNIAKIINPDFKVTQSFTPANKEQNKLAKEIFNSDKVQNAIKSYGGKYKDETLKSSLVENKQMYKNHFIDQKFDEGLRKITKQITGKELGISNLNEKITGSKDITNWLETLRNLTYKALDIGDSPFVKKNFESRLASYIRAQGIKSAEEIPDEAINLAIEEAMKATYKDNSWAVKFVQGLKDSGGKIPLVGKPLAESAIPFVQAPANIGARMVDYSPIRGTKGLYDIIKGANANNQDLVRRGIEEASKGLTGTATIALGVALYNAGIITGAESKDKDQAAFEKNTEGFRPYSVRVGKSYNPFDWAQPGAEGLIVGVLLADAIKKSDEYDSDLLNYVEGLTGIKTPKAADIALGVAEEGGKAAVNSWFNAAPVQSLAEIFKGNSAGGQDIAGNLWDTLVEGGVGAFVPSAVNAAAKTADEYTRNTKDYSSKTASFINQQIAKIPILSKTLPIKYDAWGRPVKYDSKLEAGYAKFIAPGNYGVDKSDDLDKEIVRLYDNNPENKAVFPHQMDYNDAKIKTADGEKKLNNAEMSEYQKQTGEMSHDMAETFYKSDAYKSYSDSEKIKTLDTMYQYAKAKSATQFGKPLDDDYKRIDEAYEKNGVKGAVAYAEYKNKKGALDSKSTDNLLSVVKKFSKEEQKQLIPLAIDEANNKTEAKRWEDCKGNVDKYWASYDTAQKKARLDQVKKEQEKKAQQTRLKQLNIKNADQVQKELSSLGVVDKVDSVEKYAHAKKTLSSMTPKNYADYVKKMARGDGDICQTDVIKYANENHFTQKEMDTYWKAFTNTKKIPKLSKKGNWYVR